MKRVPSREAIPHVDTVLTTLRGTETTGRTGDRPPVAEEAFETDYPRCVYQPDDGDGGWTVTMPINIHVTVPGERRALAAVEAEFTGLESVRWIRIFPDATIRAWDRDRKRLVAPDYSIRRPRLGDEWTHVHVWELDADRVAIHAHLDVVDREYE